MKRQNKQFGMTLIETTVTVAVVSLLAVLATPSIRAYFNAIGSPAEVKGAISAAFASARAIAAKEQHYAGVRFQQDSSGKQYMIFIVNDPNLVDADAVLHFYKETNGFRAAEGFHPIKLPDNIGVMEFVNNNADLDDADKVIDKTTFTVIFSPAGKLVIHFAPVLRAGTYDAIFNNNPTLSNVMFEDDYRNTYPFLQESSVNSFIIYDKTEFSKMDVLTRYWDYVKQLDVIYTNPYTGTIIQGN